MHQSNAPRSSLAILALAAVLGLTAVGLTQCRTVTSPDPGVELSTPNSSLSGRHHGNDCIRSCNRAFRSALYEEEHRHRKALRACGHDRSCRRAENAKHDDNVRALETVRRKCKAGCYNEGGGKGN